MSTSITARAAGPRAKIGLLILGSFAGVMAADAASASPDDNPPTITVKYSKQSLETDAGVTALYRRITYAAQQVCPEASIPNRNLQKRIEQCRDQAVARAIREIDNSRLAALYAIHSKNG
jgi:UrcA family protein